MTGLAKEKKVNGWEELTSEKEIITVIGAGGKSTCIRYLAEKYASMGKRVLVPTTTHMRRPLTGACLRGTAEEILQTLEGTGYAVAGIPLKEGSVDKIKGLPPEILSRVIAKADVTLIEGDGSRGLPVKVPAPHEPVIVPQTTKILLLAGLSCLGSELGEICHRRELAARILNCSQEHRITPEDLAVLLREGYLLPLRETGKDIPVTVILNQGDTRERREKASKCRQLIKDMPVVITSLSKGKTYDSIF